MSKRSRQQRAAAQGSLDDAITINCLRIADQLIPPVESSRHVCAGCKSPVWVAHTSFAAVAQNQPGIEARISCVQCSTVEIEKARRHGKPFRSMPLTDMQRAEIRRACPDWKG